MKTCLYLFYSWCYICGILTLSYSFEKSIIHTYPFIGFFSCSPDEETQAPTNTVQTTTPEPVVVQYTLTVTVSEGGSVTDGGTFDDGTEVTITATPDEGYEFVGWEGNDSSNSDLTITLNSNQTIQPIFQTVVVQYTLTITAGDGGSVTDGGTFDDGTEVTITATPNEGYQFIGWEPIDDRGILYSQTISFTLNSDIILTPIFLENLQYTLTIYVPDGGGTVSSEDGTIDTSLNIQTTYQAGTELILTASPDQGYGFMFWTNYSNNTSYSVESETISITLNSDTEIDVFFGYTTTINCAISPGILVDYEYNQLNFNEPPLENVIWDTGDIITSSDPSLFSGIEYKGTGQREMYDRRNGGAWINIEPYLFDTNFSDGLKTEIQINPEFTLDEATVEANKYAFLIGQLPTALRKDVQTMWIHKGEELFGGGNYNILVHTGMSEQYENDFTASVIEEILIHEATHTSIDNYHYPNGGWTNSGYSDGEGWIEAVENDNECYLTTYARDYQYREDLAELMPFYVAVRYFPERISSELRDKILSCNFNRIKYLDSLNLDMSLYEN